MTGSLIKINIRNKKGLSLTELIVASVLISIVMVGVISFSSSIKQMQNTTTNSTVPSVRLSSLMFEITQDATLAIGDDSDTGIQWDDTNNPRYLCFRQDKDLAGNTLDTPENYADDRWVCYIMDTTDWLIHKCLDTDPAQCQDGTTTPQFQNLLELSHTQSDFFIVELTASKIDYINILLITSADPSAAHHPITNPEFQLTTNINPPGLSR